jgi:hypothetical protein
LQALGDVADLYEQVLLFDLNLSDGWRDEPFGDRADDKPDRPDAAHQARADRLASREYRDELIARIAGDIGNGPEEGWLDLYRDGPRVLREGDPPGQSDGCGEPA